MTKFDAQVEDRMIELLADRALGTLSREDAAELEQLLARYPHLDTDVLDIAAASLDLAWTKRPYEPLPAHLADRVEMAIAAET